MTTMALETISVEHKIPTIDEYHPASTAKPTQRKCALNICILGIDDCEHREQHEHSYLCVRDRRDSCPSCALVSPRKTSKRNNVQNYNPKERR